MVSIRAAGGSADVSLARGLFEEYAAWLAVDLCFQGFAQELATLPGAYAPPRGRLLLAGAPGDAFGCVALRPLGDGNHEGEVKRLYVQPRARGGGWGRALALALIGEARSIGYRTLRLDTLAQMTEARRLYESLGFVECAPYYANPMPDPVFMALDLTSARN
jgi:ribosomal protein S18 acetylase RimI-like enzyme